MAAKYDFYKTPVSKDSMKRPRFHARIVSSGTIDTDDLANVSMVDVPSRRQT